MYTSHVLPLKLHDISIFTPFLLELHNANKNNFSDSQVQSPVLLVKGAKQNTVLDKKFLEGEIINGYNDKGNGKKTLVNEMREIS